MADSSELVRRFYAALDEHRYDDLSRILSPSFTQYRPDRTFENRAAFVTFMREGRPMTDTTHEIERVLTDAEGAAVQGRLLNADGDGLFRFCDVHTVVDGRITCLRTYTQGHPE